LLIAGLGFWFGGSLSAPNFATLRMTTQPAAEGVPSAQGLLTLASLKLPAACVPLSHQPRSQEQAAQIAASLSNGLLEGLHCCTECHHAGGNLAGAVQLAAISQRNCQVCHRS
jgi:hypothetical protein